MHSSLFFFKNPTPPTTREKHFLKRETKRREQIIPSLSLSVRARKTHLLWTKERNFKRKEREREGKERESFCVPFSFRRERERERKNFDFEISRFSSTCTHSRFYYARASHQRKQRPLAFPGNAFFRAFRLRERKNVSEQQKTRHVAKRGPRLHLPSHQQSPLSNAITQLGEKV